MVPTPASKRVSAERLAELACRMSAASVLGTSWLPAADVAVSQLAAIAPGAGAAIAVRLPGQDHLRAIAVEGLPCWSTGGRFPSDAVPLLVDALNNPERVLSSQNPAAAALDGETAPRGRITLLSAAVPARGPASVVLLLMAPPATPLRADLAHALDVVRSVLAVSVAGQPEQAGPDPLSGRAIRAIRRAKREWEDTADAMPALLGLLDGEGRILRVNRAIERLVGLPVEQAVGKTLHEILHPTCGGGRCTLAGALATGWADLAAGSAAELEFEDVAQAVYWRVHLLRISTRGRGSERAGVGRAAFTVRDVTNVRRAERLLQDSKASLECRVTERTRELTSANMALRDEIKRRVAAETSLRASRNELQQLTDQRVQLQEDERKRIADDLHDAVGQTLSAIKYSLERALQQLARPALGPVTPMLEKAVSDVQRVVDDVRTISMNLRPSVLDDLGAASAVRWLCTEWGSVYTSVRMVTRVDVADADIPAPLATTVFRSIQESLNNVAKHSGATIVEVRVRRTAQHVEVRVRDNGQGFNSRENHLASRGSHGLRSMRERAERVGGRFAVKSTPGNGTTVDVAWPLRPPGDDHEGPACVN